MDMNVNHLPCLSESILSREDKFDEQDQALIVLIQTGLPISATPYTDLGKELGMAESEVLERLKRLNQSNIIKRSGVIVRHHELGYRANAMVVWDVSDEIIGKLGLCLGQFDFITLCYRRPRRLPDWPYNLFTMIHGKNRGNVLENIQYLINRYDLNEIEYEILFSTRRFKQRGAIYHKLSSELNTRVDKTDG